MGLLSSLKISSSALTAERLRMDVIANNVANMNTTRTAEGGPYRREMVTFAAKTNGLSFLSFFHRNRDSDPAAAGGGVAVNSILKDNTPPRRVFNPEHPDADAEGFVLMPNINIVTEMTDLLSANRAYEANVTVLNAIKNMALNALSIGRR